jgi:hypothetical protein
MSTNEKDDDKSKVPETIYQKMNSTNEKKEHSASINDKTIDEKKDDESKNNTCFKIPDPIYQKMDSTNKKAVDVWGKEGQSAAIKHMFTDRETGSTRSYAEMRSMYG